MSDTEDLAALNDRLMAKNHALAEALSRAGKELTKAKSQLAQLAQPPLTFATMVKVDSTRTDEDGIQHASAEVISGTRRMVVPVASNVNAARLAAGATVMLNEKLVLVEQRDADTVGQIRSVKQVLDDGRLIVTDASGNPVLIRRSGALAYAGINQGDRIIVDPSVRLAIEALPAEGDKDLVLEETPDVTFADIGGLDSEIGRIRDAVQLPFQHRALFERYDLKPPKGVLLYGPPGNGKTMIAKAVANALCEGGYDSNGDGAISPAETHVKGVFLSVKGPELLNKYVGESERLIRLIFQRARERAADGNPVVVFIDEMDSLLRTRGSGVSSDVETTIVPQFLSELDGVESLDNVMVIGASNRVDMIDPAVLRPGRLDVKIRVVRPKANQAIAIVDHYLTDDLPLEDGVDAHALSAVLAHDIYGTSERRHLCVTFADIGGLDSEIGRIRDAVQLPFQHRALFERYDLKPPKGVLLYGPPGNGKTMIAKAVANALCEGGYDSNGDGAISPAETHVKGVFLSVKGPELLNKYVGESERLIRLIFQRARERAADGNPVVVFIDEMDSLLRTRGSGVSSDVETTIVPQFLSELDGVESLDNVMVIGASNRVDMIDPAVLRPGRLDVKIRVVRPKANQAIAIVDHYLTDDLPLEDGVDAHALSAVLAHDIYGTSERRHLCDVQEENGQWHALFLADVVSGAMLKNIVDRAKTRAVKESIETGLDVALTVPLLAAAVEDEYRETRDSMADVDPEQWSRINGMDPIRRIRTAE